MPDRRAFIGGAAAVAVTAAWARADQAGGTMRVYIGTYSQRDSRGIYIAEFDPAGGALTLTGETAELTNPSFLALHPSGRWLYSVSEIGNFNGTRGGAVAALAVGAGGALTLLGQQPTHGGAPCHLTVDPTGAVLLTANYSGGNVAVHPIGDDGSLAAPSCVVQHEGKSVNPQRQEGPHAHSINLDVTGRLAFVCDLGLDQVLLYDLDPAAGTLTPHEPPHAVTHAGAGPRHFALHPSGRFAYVINELDSTMTAFAYDAAAGSLSEIHHLSTLPDDYDGRSHCADVHAHPNGRFVYGSNRGHDSLAIYSVDQATGRLTTAGWESTGGRTPRNFALTPDGAWCIAANQEGDNLVVFAVDPATGALSRTGPEVPVPAPVCVLFAPGAAG